MINLFRRFFRAVRLCFIFVFSPHKFAQCEDQEMRRANAEEEKKKHEERAQQADEEASQRYIVVRRALLKSLFAVVVSVGIGVFIGKIPQLLCYCVLEITVNVLEVVGACLLLWAVLFVRGWEIQTIGGFTLTEQVNQWIYRALSIVGTVVFVSAVSAHQCVWS
jgi:uncharacterized membrane protein